MQHSNNQVISIHLGQSGINLGNQCWKQLCLEHDIQFNGKVNNNNLEKENQFQNFFRETRSGGYTPLTIIGDTELNATDQLKTDELGRYLDVSNILTSKLSCSNNYAIGHYTEGKDLINLIEDRVRMLADNCYQLKGFIIYHGLGGGTGSGLGHLLLERLSVDYPKQTKMNFSLISGQETQSSYLEPYNTFLGFQGLIDQSNATFVLDNDKIYKRLQLLGVQQPNFDDMNKITSQVISQVTSPMRFDTGTQNIKEFSNKIVHFPRLAFLSASLAQIYPQKRDSTNIASDNINEDNKDLFSIFENKNYFAQGDYKSGKNIANMTIFRGNQSDQEINECIKRIKEYEDNQIIDWIQDNQSFETVRNKARVIENSLLQVTENLACNISNNTAMSENFERILKNFTKMYRKKAYISHFLSNGMDEQEFEIARENLEYLLIDYDDVLKYEEVEGEQLDVAQEEI